MSLSTPFASRHIVIIVENETKTSPYGFLDVLATDADDRHIMLLRSSIPSLLSVHDNIEILPS